MNLSIPILICDKNEEIRLLLKDMLTKHGCFHLIEAHSSEETLQLLGENQFILIHKNLINDQIKKELFRSRNFLIITQPEDKETISLAAHFGVEHLISFPYSSKGLIGKINQILN